MAEDPALDRTAGELRTYLKSIDPGDRRKSWWLGWAASLGFNILLFAALTIVVLRWRGLI